MPTTLIINADDLGFSVGVTDGILRSFREGVLTSATLMATMPDRERATDLAGQAGAGGKAEGPGLGVGVHLCLTKGSPLTKCRRLLGRDGHFERSVPKLLLKLRGGASKAAIAEAQAEMVAQIEWTKRRGIHVTHVDSHKHVGHLPALQGAMIEACLQTGVRWLRTARELRLEGGPGEARGRRLKVGYRVLSRCAEKLAQRAAAAGLKTNDWFYGLATTGRVDARAITTLAKNCPAGIGELMVHPGYAQDLTAGDTRLRQERVAEMEALCDDGVKAALAAAGIRLGRYGD